MIILPAIDIINGEAVRLYQGDYSKKEVFSSSPLDVAKSFENDGATSIHLVDLDGAKSGKTDNFDLVARIVEETSLSVEIGGGIRDIDRAKRYIEVGVDRVILGTSAVKDREFLQNAVSTFKSKIAVGVDAKDGYVAVSGWEEKTMLDSVGFCKTLCDMGVANIIYTDISKDGAMQGTNMQIYKRLMNIKGTTFTASGGVSTLDEITKLSKMGLFGCILGKAIYTKAINLKDALSIVK